MTDHEETLTDIAVSALQALLRNTTNDRHRDLWKLALARVQQTRKDIRTDEALAIDRLAGRIRP